MEGDLISDPFEFKLTPDEQKTCDYLDELNSYDKFFEYNKPSDLLKGAIWLVRNPDKTNADRLYQAANSLREIFYCLGDDRKNKLKEFSGLTVEEQKSIEISARLHDLYVVLTNIAHHFKSGKSYEHSEKQLKDWGISFDDGVVSDQAFEGVIKYFIQLLKKSSVDFVEIHKKVDDLIKAGPTSAKTEYLAFLFKLHFDTKNYFYSKVDESWFGWLVEKDFFESVKNPPKEDSDERYYHSPEMEYLIRVSEVAPEKFTDFFQSFVISENNHDVGILNRAIWAIEKLPATELNKMVKKMFDENWSGLLGDNRNSGFQYDGMFTTLVTAGDWSGVLILAKHLLKLQPRDDDGKFDVWNEKLFYVNDLGYSKIFQHLVAIPKENSEDAVELLSGVFGEIEDRVTKNRGEVFQDGDNFSYRDVDFYTLSPTEADGRSARENIKNVAAAFRKVLEKVFSENCEDSLRIRDLFERLINSLPDSRPVWRLRLYVMSLCPDVFAEDLKNAFFRIFEVGDKYHEIDGGTEYQKTLRSCFKVLTEDEKRKYVENTFAYFIKQSEENPDEKDHLYSGWQNLSSISEHLTEAEKELCKEKFGIEIKNEFEPEPVMSQSRGGMISDRSPVNLSEYTVTEIVEHLKTDWTPKILDEKYKADDFLSPRNAQGLGDGIKSDLKERSESYLANAESFFDREHIHPHYTYSLLRSVE